MAEKSEKIATSDVWAEQRVLVKFCVELGKTPTETRNFINSSTKRPNISRALVYKWHKRFQDGRETTEDESRTGRPAVRTERTLTLVKNVIDQDRRYTVRDIAELCDLSRTTVHTILSEDFGMKRLCARWVPRLLSDDHKSARVNAAKSFLQKWKIGGETFLDRIITTDESWFHYFEPESKRQSSVWKSKNSPPPKKAKLVKSMGKNMFILFMDRHGMILCHAVPHGTTVNAEYYSKILRRDLVQALKKKRPTLAENLENLILHQDNAPAHTAAKTSLEIKLLGLETMHHAPYSPDLAPMDFAVFPLIKSQLRGRKFKDLDELRAATMLIISRIEREWYGKVFDKWVKDN